MVINFVFWAFSCSDARTVFRNVSKVDGLQRVNFESDHGDDPYVGICKKWAPVDNDSDSELVFLGDEGNYELTLSNKNVEYMLKTMNSQISIHIGEQKSKKTSSDWKERGLR